MLAMLHLHRDVDIRHVLPAIRVPALVVHRVGDTYREVGRGRYLAAHIPGANFVELPGRDHLPYVGDQNSVLDEVEEFLTGSTGGQSQTGCWPPSCSPTSSAHRTGRPGRGRPLA
jgi:pimeloyl-ACP methyl ester carboxylesterase